jgi:hypothetical protein
MIEADAEEIICENLREGENLDGEKNKLKVLAFNHMWKHRFGARGLYVRIHASKEMIAELELKLKSSELFGNYHDILKKDQEVWRRYLEVWWEHGKSYYAEIAIHYLLGKDWHLVYEFNDLNFWGHLPDGYLNDAPYDVKTRQKNKWGLAVYSEVLQDDYYILAHFYDDLVHLIGYTTKEKLEPTKATSRFNNYWMPACMLHSIEYFTPEKVSLGFNYILGSEEPPATRKIP